MQRGTWLVRAQWALGISAPPPLSESYGAGVAHVQLVQKERMDTELLTRQLNTLSVSLRTWTALPTDVFGHVQVSLDLRSQVEKKNVQEGGGTPGRWPGSDGDRPCRGL